MKKLFLFLFLMNVFAAFAQGKNENELIARTYLLSHTVFGTKDSLTLEELFAKTASYGHSHGNIQSRDQAINGISHNQSTYTDTAVSEISVTVAGDDAAIVRHLFRATEHTKEGKNIPLNFTIMLVWLKEKGIWKLFGRQAVSLP